MLAALMPPSGICSMVLPTRSNCVVFRYIGYENPAVRRPLASMPHVLLKSVYPPSSTVLPPSVCTLSSLWWVVTVTTGKYTYEPPEVLNRDFDELRSIATPDVCPFATTSEIGSSICIDGMRASVLGRPFFSSTVKPPMVKRSDVYVPG